MDKYMAANGVSREQALEFYEEQYRKMMGISPNETISVLRDPDGGTVTVTLDALAHIMQKRTDGRERYIPFFRGVIEDPYEIIWTEYETPGGDRKYRKKYVGVYDTKGRAGVIGIAEIQPDGTVLWNVLNARKKSIDRQRRGLKVLYGR